MKEVIDALRSRASAARERSKQLHISKEEIRSAHHDGIADGLDMAIQLLEAANMASESGPTGPAKP